MHTNRCVVYLITSTGGGGGALLVMGGATGMCPVGIWVANWSVGGAGGGGGGTPIGFGTA